MSREELKEVVEEINVLDKCLNAYEKVKSREKGYRDSLYTTEVAGEDVSNTTVEVEIYKSLLRYRDELNKQIDNFCNK